MNQMDIDALRTVAVETGQHFIGGKTVDSASGATIDTISPIDGEVLTTLAAGGAEDVDKAVAEARRAFESGHWSGLAPAQRGQVLQKIADRIMEDSLAIAVLGARDNGTEISMAIKAEPGSAAGTFRYYGELCGKTYDEIAPTPPGILGLIHSEPVGVVGAIVPWNFPLMIAAWKIAPALAAGNSVVLKPPEVASLTLLRLAQICADCGLPDGVLNVVTGTGVDAGAALAMHMDVDVLTFTGSGGVGRQLLEYAARSNLKRVYLELGGKSPLVIFADAPDLDAAASAAVGAIFRDSGQVCVAASRLLVENSIADDFKARLIEKARAIKVGDPLDCATEAGAIASETQMKNILSACARATEEGAECLLGGNRILEKTGGFYIEPTVFGNVGRNSDIARKEVFGPVLAVQEFSGEDEAVSLANDTEYGLAAGVFTKDLGRAHRMIRALRAGVVHVNTYGGTDVTVPMGGMKQSGNGYDKGIHALEKFVNRKTAWIKL